LNRFTWSLRSFGGQMERPLGADFEILEL